MLTDQVPRRMVVAGQQHAVVFLDQSATFAGVTYSATHRTRKFGTGKRSSKSAPSTAALLPRAGHVHPIRVFLLIRIAVTQNEADREGVEHEAQTGQKRRHGPGQRQTNAAQVRSPARDHGDQRRVEPLSDLCRVVREGCSWCYSVVFDMSQHPPRLPTV